MSTYIRLTDYKSSEEKEQEFFNPENHYEAKQEYFEDIGARAFEEIGGEVVQSVAFVLEKIKN